MVMMAVVMAKVGPVVTCEHVCVCGHEPLCVRVCALVPPRMPRLSAPGCARSSQLNPTAAPASRGRLRSV